jgi:CotH kinase protein
LSLLVQFSRVSNAVIRFFFVFGILLLQGCSDDESKEKPIIATGVPHVSIITNNNVSIDGEYVAGEVTITEGARASFRGSMRVKVRGNSSAGYPKRPYRIKLDASSEVLGLAKNKDWVLLANFLDGTLLTNAVALKTASLLEMPFTNHIIPVDVSVNGVYQGSYNLTEQIETGKNRVDVEPNGQLLELDQYFDETWQFRSAQFDLPVMIHYPKLTSETELQPIQNQFDVLTALMADPSFPENNYLNYIDQGSIINFFVVMLMTDNEELNHPKSIFIYKPAGGKYHLGPVWDFDWGFGFEQDFAHFSTHSYPLFWSPVDNYSGGSFFSRFLDDPQTKAKLTLTWNTFKTNKLPKLLAYVDDYSKQIASSYKKDYALWESQQGGRSPELNVENVKNWLVNRAAFIDTYLASLP